MGEKLQRRTEQKKAITDALNSADGFVSAQQLHRQLADAGTSVGLATVYRQLNALAASGHADRITNADGQAFRACRTNGHHHHLVCEGCGRVAEIETPDEDWIHRSAAQHGFTVSRHVLEAFGQCSACRTG